jgi:type VI secretion system protein ImpM
VTDVTESHLGFYGKLPDRADFVVRGLPESFLTPLGDWIEHCLSAARAAIGARWSDLYLTSPAWHFALAAGLAGPQAAVGVMVPSLDRAGREFPFLIAACSDAAAGPTALAIAAAAWLDRAAEIAVAAVTRNTDPARIEMEVRSLGRPWSGMEKAAKPLAVKGGRRLEGVGELGAALPHLLDHMAAGGRASLWWGEGSAAIAPMTLLCDGLPEPRRFAAMIDGRWKDHGW